LINNPDLILLDEPTTGLDPIGTREMKDLILSLKQQGKTVLLCSHLLADVQDVCDRITILFRGQMMELGYVRDLIEVKDITQIQARGLNADQAEQARQFLSRLGGSEATITHPTTTLEDLFIRIVREHTGTEANAPLTGSYTGSD
jgi:ABC-2 type transport system ATP-binding protein